VDVRRNSPEFAATKVYSMQWRTLLSVVMALIAAGCEHVPAIRPSGLAPMSNTGDSRVEQATLGGFHGWITQAHITSDGQRVIVAGSGYEYQEPNHRSATFDILINPASAMGDRLNYAPKTIRVPESDLHVFSVRSGKQIRSIQTLDEWKSSPSNDRLLLTADSGNLLRCWDLESGHQTAALAISKEAGMLFGPMAIAPDGSQAAVVLHRQEQTGEIVIVDLVRSTILRRIDATCNQPGKTFIESLKFSPDNRLLAVEANQYMRLVDTSTGDILPIVPSGTRCLWFDGDHHLMALSYGYVDQLNISTGKLIHRFPLQKQGLLPVAVSPDGLLLATTNDRHIQIWNLAAEKQACCVFKQAGDIITMRFSADGQQLFTVNRDWVFRKLTLKPAGVSQNTHSH